MRTHTPYHPQTTTRRSHGQTEESGFGPGERARAIEGIRHIVLCAGTSSTELNAADISVATQI
jgi:hypothetical protein